MEGRVDLVGSLMPEIYPQSDHLSTTDWAQVSDSPVHTRKLLYHSGV